MPGEVLFSSQGLCFFQTFKNDPFLPQRPSPVKRFGRHYHPGASLTPGCSCSLQTAFTLRFFPDLWVQRLFSAGQPELCVLYFQARARAQARADSQSTERITALVSGELPRLSSGPCFPSVSPSPVPAVTVLQQADPCLWVCPIFLLSQKAPVLLKCNFAPWVERNDH